MIFPLYARMEPVAESPMVVRCPFILRRRDSPEGFISG